MPERVETMSAGGCGRSKLAREVARGNFKRAIPTEVRRELSALQGKDNWRNVLYLGVDWAVVAAAILATIASGMNPLVYALAVLVIGSRQRALMNLVHQGSHKKLFRSRSLNDWAGKLFAAFPILTSLSAYTCAHCRHHGFLWNEEKDPDAIRYAQLGLVSPPVDVPRFGVRALLRPILLLHVAHNVVSALSWEGEPRSETVQRAAFWAVVLTVVVSTGLVVPFLLFWAVPFLTTFQVLRYWAEMAEHSGLRSDDPWMATRNWTSSFVTRELLAPHSDNYHLAHHLFPLIPHYNINAAHRLLMRVPEYAGAHQCDGFFWPRRVDAPSVLQDIRRPQDIGKFSPLLEGRGVAFEERRGTGHEDEEARVPGCSPGGACSGYGA